MNSSTSYNVSLSKKGLHVPSEALWLIASACIFLFQNLRGAAQEFTWADLQTGAWIITGLIVFSYCLQILSGRFIFFSARNLVLFGVIYWILSDVLQMIPRLYTLKTETAARALNYVFLFVLAVQFGHLIPPVRFLKKKFLNLKDPTASNFAFILFCAVFCIGVFPYFFYSDWSLERVWQGILSSRSPEAEVGWQRDVLGDERALILSLDFFLIAFPALAAFYAVTFKKSYFQKSVLLLLTILVCIAEFYMGTRQVFGFVILTPLLIFYLSAPKKKRKNLVFLFILAGAFIFYLMEVQVYKRAEGFLGGGSSVFELEKDDSGRVVTVDDNFYQFTRVIDFVPEKFNYVYFGELWYLLTRPIPRFLWEDKPTGFGLFFVRDIIGRKDTTYSYSVLGDFYVSFGVAGILFGGVFFGVLCRNLDQLISYLGASKIGIAIFTLCLFTVGMALRSLQIFIFFGYYVLAFWIAVSVSKFPFRKH